MSRLFQPIRSPVRAPLRNPFSLQAFLQGGQGSGSYDEYFEQVMLLLFAEGTNGATTLKDQSNATGNVTGSGGGVIGTAQYKHGASSMSFPTASAVITDTDSIAIASGVSFTAEGYFRPTNIAGNQVLWNHGDYALSSGYEVYIDGTGKLWIYGTNTNQAGGNAGDLTAGVWQHVALVVAGGIWKIYVDGVLKVTSGAYSLALSGVFKFGLSGVSMVGYADSFRFTSGVARYTAAFTPPDAEFPIASAAASTYCTWDLLAKSANVALSGSDLIATGNGAATNQNFRGTVRKGNGKWYWETRGANCTGVGNASASLADGAYPGSTVNGVSYNQSGAIYANGATVTTVASFLTTDVIGIALDMTVGTIAFYKNNTLVYTYTHVVPGALYPLATVYGAVGPCTANFGASTLAYEPPAGFTAGIASTRQYSTWSSTDKTSNAVVSNGNLTYTAAASFELTRGTIGKTSGKWYWEVTATTATDATIGVANASQSITGDQWVGISANSWSWAQFNGFMYTNNASGVSAGSYANGDVIGIALDMDTGTISYYKNGVFAGSQTGLTGTVHPAIGNYTSATINATANFGATPFKYTIPAGFKPGMF